MIQTLNNIPKDLERILLNLIENTTGYTKDNIFILDNINVEQDIGTQEVRYRLDFTFVKMKEENNKWKKFMILYKS